METSSPVVDFLETSTYELAKGCFKPGKIVVLYGLSGGGKTQICYRLCLDCKSVHASKAVFINANNQDSLKNDIANHCSELQLSLDLNKGDILVPFLKALSSSLCEENKAAVVLDDVHDVNEVLRVLNRSAQNGYLKNVYVVVTSLLNPGNEFHEREERFAIIKVKGFSDNEAEKYLRIPKERLNDVLQSITVLPVALSPFKKAFHSNRLENDNDYIDRYLRLMKESSEKDRALVSIKICLERAVAGNKLLYDALKYLSVFCGENITIELLVALIEETNPSHGVDEAESIVDVLVKRSIGNIHVSDTQRKYLTLHSLIKKAVKALVQDEAEWPEILRVSLQVFSRIMPRDGRHHQGDVIPKILMHALSLHKSYNKRTKSQAADELTKLLYAELQTSIGYCMMSQRHDAKDVISKLEEGKRLFLELLFNDDYSSDNFENGINDFLKCEDRRRRFMPSDRVYRAYIDSLPMMYRLSERDFKTLFPDADSKDLYKFKKSDHLSTIGLEWLKRQPDGVLLPTEKLAVLYPLELFAQHLHLLSKSYGNLKREEGQRESEMISQEAEKVYNRIKDQCGVTLLGLYINKRHLLNLQTEIVALEELDALSTNWKDLRERCSGKVYESGIVRSKEMSQDEYHQLICLEGEMLVCGAIARQTSDEARKKHQRHEGKKLIEEIEILCRKHHRPDITYSRAYIEVSKFYQLCGKYAKAISYSVKSMMNYHIYWLDKQSSKQGYPELDEDKIKKFSNIYKQLEVCMKLFKENSRDSKMELFKEEKKYLEEVNMAWQRKSKRSQEGFDKTFEAIIELSELLNKEISSLPVQDKSDGSD